MNESDDQPVDIRALARKKYETYMQQKRAHEELQNMGFASEQIEARISQQQQEQAQIQEGISSQQGQNVNKQNQNSSDQRNSQQRNQILTELTMKITERFQKEMNQDSINKSKQKENMKLEQKISKEIENCTCPICYELMVPPSNSPILIFPCGHTFCKTCLIPRDKVKLSKCPFCRKPFQSFAVNIHLQNIICAYTDNKHLLEKFKDQIEDINNSSNVADPTAQKKLSKNIENDQTSTEGQTYDQNLKLYSLRCSILEQEKDEIVENIHKNQERISTHTTVVESLEKQKSNVQQKLAKLQQELSLINNFINENQKTISESDEKVNQDKEKLDLLNQTLIPLQQERQKYQILSSNKNSITKK